MYISKIHGKTLAARGGVCKQRHMYYSTCILHVKQQLTSHLIALYMHMRIKIQYLSQALA